MRTLDPTRSIPAIGWQIALTVLCGLALAWLIINASISIVLGGLGVLLLSALFLARPELALLVALFARAVTDLSFWTLGGALVRERIGALPNVALILVLVLGGGFFILGRSVPMVSLPGGKLFALFLLTGLVGSFRSDSLVSSFNEWIPVVSSFIVYALAAHLFRSSRQVQRGIDVLGASFAIPALFGFYQLITGQGLFLPQVGANRIYGTFFHPNTFALYLVVILSVFLCQALVHSGGRRYLALSIAAAVAPLLVGTFTRVGWVGSAVVLLTVGALRKRALLVVVPLIVVMAALLIPAIAARLSDPLGTSFADRVDLWRATLPQLREAVREAGSSIATVLNWLGGLGPGSVDVLTFRVRGSAFAAHNDYLKILVEYGLLGLGLYLALSLVLIMTSYRTWRELRDKQMAAVALSFLALALAFPVMSITENVFGGTQNQLYFWTLAGLTVAIRRIRR